MFHKTGVDQKKTVFMWVLGLVGIRESESADRAAKEALDKKNLRSHALFRLKTFDCQVYIYIKFGRKNGMKLF